MVELVQANYSCHTMQCKAVELSQVGREDSSSKKPSKSVEIETCFRFKGLLFNFFSSHLSALMVVMKARL